MSSAPATPLPPPARAPGAGRAIFAAQVLRLVVRLGSAAALARLLSPEVYGLHGMAAAVYGFLFIARDLGLVTALQQPSFAPAQFASVSRFAVLGGLALSAFGAALAFPTGWFFGDTSTVPLVLAALSTTLLFSAAAAPPIGVLYREQRAGTVARLDATAMTLGCLAGVIAAWCGAGVWALVLMTLLHEASACAFAWMLCPWKRLPSTAPVSWQPYVQLGRRLVGHGLAQHATRILDQITVGHAAGAAALGLYGRAAQVAALPAQFGIGPFTPWVVAELNRLRTNSRNFIAVFRRALNNLLHVSGAAAVVCFVLPDLVVRILFGPQWDGSAPVVRWLGLVLLVQPALSAPAWLLSRPADARRLLAWSVVGLLLMLLACALSYRSGLVGIARGAAIATLAHAALAPFFCRARSPVALRDWLACLPGPLALHSLLAVVLFTTRLALPAGSAALHAAILFAVACGAGFAAVRLVPRLRRELSRHLFWSR